LSILTIAWSMCAAASFMLGLLHLMLWFKNGQALVYLLSVLTNRKINRLCEPRAGPGPRQGERLARARRLVKAQPRAARTSRRCREALGQGLKGDCRRSGRT
jgi:hypothetical protein